ncbi:MAG: phosphopyruvate hydratase [Elusimicrobia bacterium CG_4_10_14_0_2_um_filter_56_8]|nr:MAG: phosphopyruvate hydratase [Elusimicrobia bacterium CG1_02_56_21]PJA12755.1 MAG: phosphopyruvate hydratase [Elusimicrobia bacterium CG_4_10_14_0_2_um_filter_56_8]
MDAKIKKITAREILDSRGFPTVETDVLLTDGSFGRAAVPSGASTGTHEALEMRDGGKRYLGKGVTKAVDIVNKTIAAEITGLKADQIKLEEMMIKLDDTQTKSKLGANSILSVSMALARAGAASAKLPLYAYIRKAYGLKHKDFILPAPMMNIINGGKHADSGLSIQEFMIVPTGAARFTDALRMGCEIYQTLKKILARAGYTTAVGDEGGFAPKIFTHESVLETICNSIKEAGYNFKEVQIALDSAASEFFQNDRYVFEGSNLSYQELTAKYSEWRKHFPIISYEDPLAEDDWEGWEHLSKHLCKKARVVGDDLFVTNPERLKKGIEDGVANAILIKPNQIGSLTETIRVIEMAQKAGYATVISHRSGETEDSFIADLAVATNAGAIKTGAPCRSERLSKYNQLVRIEEELGKKARYAKDSVFKFK